MHPCVAGPSPEAKMSVLLRLPLLLLVLLQLLLLLLQWLQLVGVFLGLSFHE